MAEVKDRQIKESDGYGGTVEVSRKLPVWLRPHSGAQTPMCQALRYAEVAISEWVDRHPCSFPPIVINISDGNATDGDPEPIAQRVMDLGTSDGGALVFNCHLSENTSIPTQFPYSENFLQDKFARQMFRMSSLMPPGVRDYAARLGISVNAESRCCVFNADMVSLVHFLDIGTSGPSNLH